MSGSVMIWVMCAVLMFWALGAYKRLLHLRSLVIAAFEPLDANFGNYVTLVQSSFASAASAALPAGQAGLVGAIQQFDSSIKVARTHPLDVMAIRALETAHEALCTSWLRVCNEPPDLAGAPLPEVLQRQWEHVSLNAGDARAEFNRRVQDYNEAIRQFPARLLACLFGFKPAQKI
jgi:LemA protein